VVGCVHSNVKDSRVAGCVYIMCQDRVMWWAVYTVMFRIESHGRLCT
jgi:hypothetical protein